MADTSVAQGRVLASGVLVLLGMTVLAVQVSAVEYFRRWKTYYSPEANFSVQFPDKPAPIPIRRTGQYQGETLTVRGFVVQLPDRMWGIMVTDQLIPKFHAKYLTTTSQINSFLDSYITGAMKSPEMQATGGTLQSIESVRLLDKYPGRHAIVMLSNTFVDELYVYLVDGVVYQLEFGHSPSASASLPSVELDGDLFFKSFRLGSQGIPAGAIRLPAP